MKFFNQLSVFAILNIALLAPVSAGSLSERFNRWLLEEEASTPVAKAETVRLDVSSAKCMQCHNGRTSGHIVVKSANSAMQFAASGRQSNHPIGMKYDDYALKDPNSYQPRALLDPNIRLVGGRVACISCHQVNQYSKGAGHGLGSLLKVSAARDMNTSKMNLTVGPKVTDLCMACHTI